VTGDGPVSVDEARARLRAVVAPLPVERVPTLQALGRVLAEPVTTAVALPPFDQSAVDGYAVRHGDVASVPARLPVVGVVPATGHAERPVLAPVTAMRIFTGGLVPEGADTIVRQELTRREGDDVVIGEAVAPGTDLRRAGEEVPAGAVVAGAGTEVTAGLVGALSVAGAAAVAVRRRPRVHVLVTGDEVVAAGQPLALGQVYDANRPAMVAHLTAWGCEVVAAEHVVDEEGALRDALARALDGADLVVTSGGVSVGDLDLVPAVTESLGAERVLWRVAQRPGGPLYVARRGSTVLLGLPGNPAAVVVNLAVYARLALDLLAGTDPDRRWRRGVLEGEVRRDERKALWLRMTARTDDTGTVRLAPLSGQASHMLGNLAHANALVRVPPTSEPLPAALPWLPLR